MKDNTYKLEDGYDVAYIMLPRHPGIGTFGCIDKTIRLLEVIKDYKGPDIYLNFDPKGFLVGVEILEE